MSEWTCAVAARRPSSTGSGRRAKRNVESESAIVRATLKFGRGAGAEVEIFHRHGQVVLKAMGMTRGALQPKLSRN